jgi:hypothetical protein
MLYPLFGVLIFNDNFFLITPATATPLISSFDLDTQISTIWSAEALSAQKN